MSYSTPTSSSSAASTLLASLLPYGLSLVALIGLVVLIALKDITGTEGLPIIAVIAGVHAGATIAGNNSGG